jgi:hypothetical protein
VPVPATNLITVGKTGIITSFLNIEQYLRGTKEYKKLVREYGENNNDGIYETIDTQAFIKWALKLGYIETDKPHVLDKRKPPYEDDFAKMLHSLLLEKNLINQLHEEGMGNKQISEYLNSQNIKTPTGKDYTRHLIGMYFYKSRKIERRLRHSELKLTNIQF